MKKNNYFKKYLMTFIVLSGIFLSILTILNVLEYNQYNQNINLKINQILNVVKKEYPEVSEAELIKILKSENNKQDILNKYGIEDTEFIIENNKINNTYFLIFKISSILIFIIISLTLFIKYKKVSSKEIEDIIEALEKIREGNYQEKLAYFKEGELSLLKNEITKIISMLKSLTDKASTDKLSLKEALEDISHQIRTPLTSIYIMLDNLVDNPSMEEEKREEFLLKIKRELSNINFLINTLLKLSMFDACTITFLKDNYKVEDILEEAILNINSLSDLKNVSLNISGDINEKIYVDKKWEIEALTNILKNALEYSYNDSHIDIVVKKYNLYLEITIKDYGKGISSNDVKHIFERFYKGECSSSDSIGIGLALSKSIILNDNGKITCESKINEGTTFKIKYFYL